LVLGQGRAEFWGEIPFLIDPMLPVYIGLDWQDAIKPKLDVKPAWSLSDVLPNLGQDL
jgi:hypothetical protein